jgi:hypothetical protein
MQRAFAKTSLRTATLYGPANMVLFAEIPAKQSDIEMQLPFGATQEGGEIIR